MFSGASNFVAGVDKAFLFIISVGLFFLIGLTVTMIVFAVKYRRKKHPKAVQVKESFVLEIAWTVIPLILVLLMFYYGYEAFTPQRTIPKDAYPIKVISKMWSWSFDYGKGKIASDTLVVPINKAISLNMVSLDVTHSFYIPAFRIKEDVVPGSITHMWFIAEQSGIYDILCAEFCGLRHSYMEGRVKVVSESEFNTWLASVKVTDENTEPKGLTIIKQNGCVACHSLDGSKLVGPSFKNIWGSEKTVVMPDGKEKQVNVDSAYITHSILAPDDEVVRGFSKGLMRPYKGIVADSAIVDIVKYFKASNDKK